jgi:tetratricopeptide (TPR) repeat protein
VSRPKRAQAQHKISSSPIGAHHSPTRKWLFRLVAVVFMPMAVLALLESGLRLAGFGFPSNFFQTRKISGKRVITENDRFGERFFPPGLARSASPFVMDAVKPTNSCRIFVLGESAALGDPEPAFGFSRYLQVLLQERFPHVRFEVICTAMTAINSHVILPIAKECAAREGDIWIIYMGNNEFVGPFGPSTAFGLQLPPLKTIRLGLMIKETRIGQLLSRLVSGKSERRDWGGMKMFLDHQIAPSDTRKRRVYDYFKSNLEGILTAARKSGSKVVLSTVAVNLKDCPPFASEHGSIQENVKSSWQQLFQTGIGFQQSGDTSGASRNFQAAAQLDSAFAELQFRWAQSLLTSSNGAEAKGHFELARDYDSLPFRVDGPLNRVIRTVATKHAADGVRLVETENALARVSGAGVPGRESFFEHVHLNFDGNYTVARGLAEAVTSFLPDDRTRDQKPMWASFDQCSKALALTRWDRRRVYETLLRRMAEPPFVGQLGHSAQIDALRQASAAERAGFTTVALSEARETYREALARSPTDLYLHANFAKLEEENGNFAGAAAQWTAVRDLIPFAPGPHYYLGKVLSAQGSVEAALLELDQALAIRRDMPEVLEEKGRTLIKANRTEQGLQVLEQASKLEPGNARVRVLIAQALAQLGRRAEALNQLRLAVQVQPGFWEAHYLLGVEIALDGDVPAAAQQFSETVRLNPSFPLGHLNLGISLAKMNRIPDAITQFEETVRLDPNNRKAAEYLQALNKPPGGH